MDGGKCSLLITKESCKEKCSLGLKNLKRDSSLQWPNRESLNTNYIILFYSCVVERIRVTYLSSHIAQEAVPGLKPNTFRCQIHLAF